MYRFPRTFLLLSLFSVLAIFATAEMLAPIDQSDLDIDTLSGGIRHTENKGIGYQTGYTTLETLMTYNWEEYSVMPFLNLRAHLFDNRKFSANVGLGLRKLYNCTVYGVNVYFDYRETRKHTYNQVSCGFEALGDLCDLRINGYFPTGSKKSRGYDVRFLEFSEHHIIIHQKHQYAMSGCHAEVGTRLGKIMGVELYGAAGPYFFSGEIGKSMWGGQVRLAGKYKSLGIELSDSYDSAFHNNVQGKVSLNFSFGPCYCLTSYDTDPSSCSYSYTDVLAERMTQPVIRDEIIVVNSHREHRKAINKATNRPYHVVFVDNTGGSEGTYESPYQTLAQAESNSSADDLIYVFAGDGTSKGMDTGFLMKDGQRLLGSSVTHQLHIKQGVITLPISDNTRPVITNSAGDVIYLANRNEISGFDIRNTSGHGISHRDTVAENAINGLVVTKNTFQGSLNGYNGIELQNTSGVVTIANNTFRNEEISINIQCEDSKEYSTYAIKKNNFATSGMVISLKDCKAFTTIISHNMAEVAGTMLSMHVSHEKATETSSDNKHHNDNKTNEKFVSNPDNTIVIARNHFTAEDQNINLLFDDHAKATVTIVNNTLLSSDTNIALNGSESSEVTLGIRENICDAANSCIVMLANNSAKISGGIGNNRFHAEGSDDVRFCALDRAKFKVSITNNEFIRSTAIEPFLNNLKISCFDNSESCFEIIHNNVERAKTNGITIEGMGSSKVSAEIGYNTITNPADFGLVLTTQEASTGKWNVHNNIFTSCPDGAVSVSSHNNSTTYLRFNYNSASPLMVTPVVGAYQFNQYDFSTFKLEPCRKNVGVITGNSTEPNADKDSFEIKCDK